MSKGDRRSAARPTLPRRKPRRKSRAPTGLEPGPGGTEVGVDPRRLSTDDLRALGHRGKPLLQAMRKRCVDCCGGKSDEVRQCTAVACPLWPYRMATDPWHPEPPAPRAAVVKAATPAAPAAPAAGPPVATASEKVAPGRSTRPRAKPAPLPSLPFMDMA